VLNTDCRFARWKPERERLASPAGPQRQEASALSAASQREGPLRRQVVVGDSQREGPLRRQVVVGDPRQGVVRKVEGPAERAERWQLPRRRPNPSVEAHCP
jgi:hypothetical protein